MTELSWWQQHTTKDQAAGEQRTPPAPEPEGDSGPGELSMAGYLTIRDRVVPQNDGLTINSGATATQAGQDSADPFAGLRMTASELARRSGGDYALTDAKTVLAQRERDAAASPPQQHEKEPDGMAAWRALR